MVLTALWKFKREIKKKSSFDSKNNGIKRFLEKLNKFKISPLKKSKNKEERILLKKTPKKFTITTTMMFTKSITIRKLIN